MITCASALAEILVIKNWKLPIFLLHKMSLTGDYIERVFRLRSASLTTKKVKDALSDVEKFQSDFEAQLLQEASTCTVPSLPEHITELNRSALQQKSQAELYDPGVLNAVLCTVDSLFYTDPKNNNDLLRRLHQHLNNLRQIGAESSGGYAFTADLDNAQKMFVVKAPRLYPVETTYSDGTSRKLTAEEIVRESGADSLVHELIVGLFGTNQLRKQIPNFSFVLGGFKCSPPIVDPSTKQVVSWCLNNDNPVNYILYENVVPSIGGTTFMATATVTQFLDFYTQMVYAIRTGQAIDFTHYDLHADNVLKREMLDKAGNKVAAFQIHYVTERGDEYFSTDFISTIIDYGYSHIKVRDVDLGVSGFEYAFILPDRSWPFFDLYKLLLFLAKDAYGAGNLPVFREAAKIFRFFNAEENIVDVIAEQYSLRYGLPLTDITANLKIDDYVTFIRTQCNCNFIGGRDPKLPLLDCDSMCLTAAQALTESGVNLDGPIRIPNTISDLYDLSVVLSREHKNQELADIEDEFDYTTAMTLHIAEAQRLARSVETRGMTVPAFSIEEMTVDEVFRQSVLIKFRAMYVFLLQLVDTATRAEWWMKIGESVADAFADQVTSDSLSAMRIAMRVTLSQVLNRTIDIRRVNEARLKKFLDYGLLSTQQAINLNNSLSWYYDQLYAIDNELDRAMIALTDGSPL